MGSTECQATGLTQNNSTYYLDTATATFQPKPPTGYNPNAQLATFTAGSSYGVFNLYSKSTTVVQYQIYVGSGFSLSNNFNWVRMDPHEQSQNNPYSGNYVIRKQKKGIKNTTTQKIPGNPSAKPNPWLDTNGVLWVTINHSGFISDYQNLITSNQQKTSKKYQKVQDSCFPADICSQANNSCVVNPSFTQAQASLDTDLAVPVQNICNYWATRTTQEVADTKPSSTKSKVYLNDCPYGGCLGFVFQLPNTWNTTSYKLSSFLGAPYSINYNQNQKSIRTLIQSTGSSCLPPSSAGNFPQN